MNPDVNGRPSPVILKLYQMKGVRAFQSADYFLLSQSVEPFSPEIVAIEEFIVQPDEVVRLKRKLAPETKYLATFAAFRDIDSARWRNASGVQNVWTFEVPFTSLAYRQDLPLRIDVDGSRVAMSSPPSAVLLDVAEESARAKQRVRAMASASGLEASLASFVSSKASAMADQALAEAEKKAQEKVEAAIADKLPKLSF